MNKLHGEVRFHLSKGANYMHWQIKVKQGRETVDVYYYDPAEYQLEMRGCKLWNRPNKAKQVYEAGVHDVSGWVRCDEVMLRKKFFPILPTLRSRLRLQISQKVFSMPHRSQSSRHIEYQLETLSHDCG